MAENQHQIIISGSPALLSQFTATGSSISPKELTGEYSISVSGISGSVVALQRSFDGGATWLTVATYAENTEEIIECRGVGILYRFECQTYGSGTVLARIQ